MESAISSLILFTVGIFAAMTISHTFLETQDVLWTSEQARQEESLTRERTDLEIIAAETEAAGALVRVQVRNSGQTKLADFEAWDLIVQYYSDPLIDPELYPDIYTIAWLPYTAGTPTDMQWSVSGIYVDAATLTPELFEPGILNPDEEMVIQARLSPSIAMTTTNYIVINTPNGIRASAHVIR
jgi:hypothetical protein